MKITPIILDRVYTAIRETEHSKENFVEGIFRSYYAKSVSQATLYRVYSSGPPFTLVAYYSKFGCPECLNILKGDILDWMENRFLCSELHILKATLFGFMTQISLEDYHTVVGPLVNADYSKTESVAMLMARILWYTMCRDCAQASLDRVA